MCGRNHFSRPVEQVNCRDPGVISFKVSYCLVRYTILSMLFCVNNKL
jgi:hypothetical protein